MKTRLMLASLATATAMAFALPSFAADSAQDFVDKAAAGGMFEVDSSKIAEGKAQDPGVKDFAHKMIEDHGAANAKLETIAGEQKLKLPTQLDAKHKGDLNALQNGKDPFDGSYVQMQRDAHSDAVTLFESYVKDGDNAAVFFGLSMGCLGMVVGGSFLLFNLLWGGVMGNAAMQVLIGIGLISGAIGGGALLLWIMDIIAKLLIRYARLHFRLFDTANASI